VPARTDKTKGRSGENVGLRGIDEISFQMAKGWPGQETLQERG